MSIRIEKINAADFLAQRGDVVAIYRAVFGLPPYKETDEDVARFAERLPKVTSQRGFRCRIATEDGAPIGFALGHLSLPGQWWHDAVGMALDPVAANRWLSDAFELVNLAVLPAARGRGIGGRIHDDLLRDLACRTAMLSTAQEETPAAHLYRARGWTVVRDDFRFPGFPLPYRIMGLDLDARRRPND